MEQLTPEQQAKLDAEQKEKQERKAKAEPSPLMREGMSAYGIRAQHVLSSRDYGDHVVIVTKGGAKVSFALGDKVVELSRVQLDGVPPPQVKK